MIDKLLTDHDNARQILNYLETQFLDLCRGIVPDYMTMQSLIVYIQEYPEQVHHPMEDAAFSIVLERGGDVERKVLRDLIRDHTEMEMITRTLRDSIETIIDSESSGIDLKGQLFTFLWRQRRHLHTEESEVYPAIKAILKERDWDDIDVMHPELPDPLFYERTNNEYEKLYQKIVG